MSALDPLPLQLTVDHSLLEFCQSSEKATTGLSWVQLAPTIKNMMRLMKEGGVLDNSGACQSVSKRRRRCSIAATAAIKTGTTVMAVGERHSNKLMIYK